MKHLEQSQILTIMDCMHPTTVAQGCCVIQEGDDGSLVYVLEGERMGVGVHVKNVALKQTVAIMAVIISFPPLLIGFSFALFLHVTRM